MNEIVQQIKDRYDLVEYIARDSGQSPKKSGGWATFVCHVHGGRSRNLRVNVGTQTVTCFSRDCFHGDDILGYVMKRGNCNFGEAVKRLSDNKPLGKVIPIKRRKPLPQLRHDFTKEVLGLRSNVDKSRDWFVSRGINQIDERLLSVDEEIHIKRTYKTIEMLAAQKGDYTYTSRAELARQLLKLTFSVPRYIIPYIGFGKITAVNARRNDLLCKEIMNNMKSEFEAMRIDISETMGLFEAGLSMISDDKLMDIVFGDKYMLWWRSRRSIYNIERVWKKTDDGYKPRAWSYLLISEGEITGASCEDATSEAGFPTIGVKTLRNLEQALKNVGEIIILGENDPEDKNGISASDKITLQILEASGRLKDATARIIKPPKEHNDFNDFFTTDRNAAIKNFTEKEGIPMIERGILQLASLQ